jgi:hypothetical protein
MATFSFPSSPVFDQIYTVGNKSWKWNGIAWVTVTAESTKSSVTPSPNPPASPRIGDLWWDSNETGGGLYTYYMYVDDDTQEDIYQWIQISSSKPDIIFTREDPVSPPTIENFDGGNSGTTLFTITIDGGSASSTFSSTIDGGNSGATQTLIDSGDSSTTTFLSTIEGGSASSTFTSTIDGGAS